MLAGARCRPTRLLPLSLAGLSVRDAEVLDTARRVGADIVGVTAVDDLPPPRPYIAGDKGCVGRLVGAVAGHVHRLCEGRCVGAGGVARAEQFEGDRAARIRRGPADGGVVVRYEVLGGG